MKDIYKRKRMTRAEIGGALYTLDHYLPGWEFFVNDGGSYGIMAPDSEGIRCTYANAAPTKQHAMVMAAINVNHGLAARGEV